LSSGLLIQVNQAETQEAGVLDAHHFRSQALLYSELAERMSLRGDAEYCRIVAERCRARAAELETHGQPAAALRDIPSSPMPIGS
jgi:hypothetical protein